MPQLMEREKTGEMQDQFRIVQRFGKIKNLAQFKKEVLPVWNRTFELLKNFAEE